jgi:hypothetical protein
MSTERNITIKHFDGTDWEKLAPKTTMSQVVGLNPKVTEVELIAKGASRARVFDDTAATNTWLSVPANVETVQIGDNFYTRSKDEPDYWWDGLTIQPLATEKVIINLASDTEDGMMTKDDFTKLQGIAEGANNYQHPSGDGNRHVPATGTDSNNKILGANGTAASESWKTLAEAGIAEAQHSHNLDDLDINTFSVGLIEPSNSINGDLWFDFNN